MRQRPTEVGFWVVVGILLFAGWAMNFAEPPLRTLGGVVFLCALLFPVLEAVVERYFVPVLRPLRTTVEPLLVFHQFWPYQGIQEADFRRKILYWRDGTIDASFYALAILTHPQFREVANDCPPTSVPFWDEELGAFRQSAESDSGLYATSMAISVLKLLEGRPLDELYEKPLGYEKAVDILRSQGIDVNRIINFATKCQDQEAGGFYDYPRDAFPQATSMQTTHSACFLLWNLDRLHLVEKRIANFVSSCLSSEQNQQKRLGFAEHPGGPALSCSTYYALRILERLGERTWIEENKYKIASFLQSCWQEGGFSAFPSSNRTLVHTCLAVATFLDILHDGSFLLQSDGLEKLVSYIKACEDRHGGFQFWDAAFGLGGRWYAANLYATQHVVEALDLLSRETRRGYIEEILDKEKIKVFVRGTQLGEGQEGLFRQYALTGSKVGIAIARAFRKLVDFLLMPRNPLKDPAITMTPVPHYLMIGCVLASSILLSVFGFLKNPVVLGLLAGPMAMGVAAIILSVRWLLLEGAAIVTITGWFRSPPHGPRSR